MFKLYWLPLNYRMHFKILLLVDKCLNGLAPIYLSELLRYSYSSRLLRSSSQNFLAALKTRQLDQTLFNFTIRLRVWLTKQYFDPNFGQIFGITFMYVTCYCSCRLVSRCDAASRSPSTVSSRVLLATFSKRLEVFPTIFVKFLAPRDVFFFLVKNSFGRRKEGISGLPKFYRKVLL